MSDKDCSRRQTGGPASPDDKPITQSQLPPRRQPWQESFDALQRYVREHGTAPLLRYVAPDGYCLGNWVSIQRVTYHNGQLSPDRVSKFERLPGWTWSSRDAAWDSRFNELQRFLGEFGKLPTTFTHEHQYLRLAKWVRAQCAARAAAQLAPDRGARLEQLPGWTWNFDAAEWQALYAALQSHLDKYGAPPAPSYLADSGLRIGSWTSKQRRMYLANDIDADHARQLEQLVGWPWAETVHDGLAESRWNTAYLALRRHVAEHGTPPPRSYVTESGFRLGPWVAKQRASHASSTLRRDRVQRLEEIAVWVWKEPARIPKSPGRSSWDSRFRDLARYVDQYGTMPLTTGGAADCAWMAAQRIAHRKGLLATERVLLLEGLPGWSWDARDSAWESTYAALQQYVSGHQRLPSVGYITPSGLRIGPWINLQRVYFKRGKLSTDRVARLERLVGWSWGAVDHRFDDASAIFEEYVRQHGTVPRTSYVTEGGFALGKWVYAQRRAYRDGRLTSCRAARVKELGVVR